MIGSGWAGVLEQAEALRRQTPAAALDLLDQHLSADLAPGVDPALGDLYELRGEILRGMGAYAEATEDAERMRSLAATSADLALEARSLLLLGTIQAQSGYLSQALQSFHQARDLVADAGLPALKARALNGIGVAHNMAGNPARAVEYARRAVSAIRASDDQQRLVLYLGNLAMMISQLDTPEAALPIYQEAIVLGEAVGDARNLARVRGTYCRLLLSLGDMARAEALCEQAAAEVDRFGDIHWQAEMRLILARLAWAQGEADHAITLLEEGLALAEDTAPFVFEEGVDQLAQWLSQLGRLEPAVAAQARLLELRETNRQNRQDELVEVLEVRYQVEQAEAELALLRLESQLQASQIHQRNLLMITLAIGLSMALLAAVGAIRSSRVQRGLRTALADRNQALEQAVDRITELARRDPLTGLLNRRALEDLAAHEMARRQREVSPMAVAMADIDHFKCINDRFGHAVGDQVILALAERLRGCFRESNPVARWGGEEFLCLLPNTTVEEAAIAIQRFLAELRDCPIQTEQGPLQVSLTFGLAAVEDQLDPALKRADAALYRGKTRGGDRLVIASQAVPDNA